MNEEYSIEEKLEEVMCENKLLQEEIKDLCKKIKVNEKSRRKMQQSLMKQLEQRDNIINKAREYVDKFIPIDEDTILMRIRQKDYLSEILNIDKGE